MRVWKNDLKDSPNFLVKEGRERKRKQNETSEERAARVCKTAARKRARVSSLNEEDSNDKEKKQG